LAEGTHRVNGLTAPIYHISECVWVCFNRRTPGRLHLGADFGIFQPGIPSLQAVLEVTPSVHRFSPDTGSHQVKSSTQTCALTYSILIYPFLFYLVKSFPLIDRVKTL